MKHYTWDDIKRRTEKISKIGQQLGNFNLVLFGARLNGSYACQKIKKEYTIYAFSDNNQELWGGTYEGVPVVSPEKLKEIKNSFVIITASSHHYLSIKKQLDDIEIPCITYMEYVLIHHYDELEQVYYTLLEDEFSKKTYISILMAYLTGDMAYFKEVFVGHQYFEIPEFCIPSREEVFVDCGAYTGDTLECYINRKSGIFKKIYCFEPTETIKRALEIRKERLLKEWALKKDQIIIEKKVVTSKNGMKYFMDYITEKTSNRSMEEQFMGNHPVTAISLDEYFTEKEEKPTFIKADIEGEELEMLKGAVKIITNGKPLLAICLYHKIDDFYEIPILLKQFHSEYKMSIRHHMPNTYESVLYCY